MGAKIIAIEYVFPQNLVTNASLATEFPDYDFSQFEEKVGIKNRYVVDKDETALDLAVKACEKLFERVERKTIDYVLYCTQSPEYLLPTTACLLQAKLGLNKNIAAYDFNLGCSGYTYGLSMAQAAISTGQAVNVLLVTAETYSKYLHPNDRSNRAIFGDAASATLISNDEKQFFGKFLFGTDGSGAEALIVKNGGSKLPFDPEAETLSYGSGNQYTSNHLYMNGPEVFNFTCSTIPNFAKDILIANQVEQHQIDQFIFHQANAFMLDFIRKKMKASTESFYIDLMDGGNTVSSTIPIALKNFSIAGKEGNKKLMLVGFGVGLSWCGGIVNIDNIL